MSNYVDIKYINILSTRLDRFKRKSDSVYIFRCPICGDSKKSKIKCRGFIYEKNDTFLFKCWNCGKGLSLSDFIKEVNTPLYQEYRAERFLNGRRKSTPQPVLLGKVTNTPVFHTMEELNDLTSIKNLSDVSVYKNYIIQRKIPERFFDKLFVTMEFKKFVNSLIPKKFELVKDEPRLLIPFFDENKRMFAFAGRSFQANSQLRYINITLDETKPKLFGLDRWDKNISTVVVEGPLDSLFVPNCISTSGGDLHTVLKKYPDCDFTIAYDNEPWSKETRDKIRKAIKAKYKVVIWPKQFKSKDINQGILDGLSELDIQEIIRDNTYSGLQAEFHLAYWR